MVKAYFKGLVLEVENGVYMPREDTELLADVMDIKENDRVLEVGIGSGALSLLAARRASHVTGVDVEPLAVDCAIYNAELNGIANIDFFKSDLFENVKGIFDVILFNIPYLPVSDPWESRAAQSAAWAGGATGRDVLERFAQEFDKYLKPEGRVYVVISSLTGLEESKKLFEGRGFRVSTAAEKKVPWETLYCLKITR